MRLGILADIHEDVGHLALALAQLRRVGAEQVVVLGDICETGSHLRETVAALRDAGATGVWGNHDLGLCLDPLPYFKDKFAGFVLDFMATLQAHWTVEDCLFSHGLPWWDATDGAVYYLGERPETLEGRQRSFAACSQRVIFVGHYHRWLAATEREWLTWNGSQPLQLLPDQRYLVVIHAVCAGWCAVFDTDSQRLEPYAVGTAQQSPVTF
jgi:predicted phosphodiesterase